VKTKAQLILYFFALPWNLTIAWPAILLVRLLWGENLRWETPPAPRPGGAVLACDLRAASWPVWTWYKPWGATTLGHGIFYNAGCVEAGKWGRIQTHEHVHVEQFEVAMFGSFFSGALACAILSGLEHPAHAVVTGLTLWWAGYLLMGVGGWLVALMRGEQPYRGSAHEESAYSQADGPPQSEAEGTPRGAP
jgi:hypothetical protein